MELFEDIACTVCGCVCDDLRVGVDNGRIRSAEGACYLAEPWFLNQDTQQPPAAAIDGVPVDIELAAGRAAEILESAASPLIYGLSRSSTEGQRAAVALAERVGSTIDTTASLCHAPSVIAMQEVGECTCTLGEIKNRADLVVFWGADPVKSHPRHMERYSVWPKGRFIPGGRRDRTVVVADVKPTGTSAVADLFLPIEPERDFEALTTLRSLIRGAPLALSSRSSVDRMQRSSTLGAPLDLLEQLAERMKTCRYGVVFFGLGLSMHGPGQQSVEALLLLVHDLNQRTRFTARRMRVPGDVTGADMVLIWQAGYPFSVNMARGYPRYNPGEFSAQDMLERGDVDAALFVGSEGIARFSERAKAQLGRIPTIVLDYPTVQPLITPTIRFTTAVYGIHKAGTVYRMDGIPIPLRPVLQTDYPSDCDVLTLIQSRLR